MSDFEESSLVESLQRAEHLLARILSLPSASTFDESVETDLWKTVTGKADPPNKVPYTDLPDVSHTLIGTYETEDGPVEPWWLREFTWTASFGGESIELRGDGLQTFATKFDRERTMIHKPELATVTEGTRVSAAFEALKTIGDELDTRIDPMPGISPPSFPDSLFTVSEGLIELIPEFEDWVDHFVSLLPGIGAEATALYLAHTGTSAEAVDSAIDGELLEQIRRLELSYDKNRTPELVRRFDEILGLSSAFNREFPNPSYDRISGLQYQLYRGFIESHGSPETVVEDLFDRAMKPTPPKLDEGEQGIFTRAACGTPLILYARRPRLMSFDMYSPATSGSSGYFDRSYNDVNAMFEAAGWFDNA